jgi:hypothetical protein
VREAESVEVRVRERKRGGCGEERHFSRPWWRRAWVEVGVEEREGVLSLRPAQVTRAIGGEER